MSFQFFASSQNGSITAPGAVADRPAARGEDKQTTLPVTIRMIENAMQDEEVCFHGLQPEVLVLVASVEALTKQPSNLDLVVSDATGRIRVRQFFSGDAADALHEGVEVGRYVHIFGQVRQKPQPHFAAQGVRLVRSADEVSYHVIEAVHSALRLKRGLRPAAPALATPMKAQLPSADLATPAITPPKAQVPAAVETPARAPGAAAPGAVLSGAALREALVAFLGAQSETKGEAGCSRIEVHAEFATAPKAEVDGLLSELVSGGDAITTIDDDHFCAV
mmetsp:Transcript_13402/g.35559  ORF Transcript_13402/g.35559 Transcript_13402/m.35559 type:complete len:278 (+) Transcript_13402:97-930(+)